MMGDSQKRYMNVVDDTVNFQTGNIPVQQMPVIQENTGGKPGNLQVAEPSY